MFAGDWSVAGLVGLPMTSNNLNGSAGPYPNAFASNGSTAETPQIQGMIKYAHDWWGKAAYYGVPNPFTVTVSAGWQRSIARDATDGTLSSLSPTERLSYLAGAAYIKQAYVNPWIVQGAMFIPVIPTHSANLAGTASILTQWFVGQGVEAFGMLGTRNGAVGNTTP